MDVRQPPAATGRPLSKPLAAAYLAIVAIVWLGHVALLAFFLATGRSSWTTDNPAIALPMLVGILAAIGVVWLMDRRLHPNRSKATEPFRLLGLVYGSAVPAAWRRLREVPPRPRRHQL